MVIDITRAELLGSYPTSTSHCLGKVGIILKRGVETFSLGCFDKRLNTLSFFYGIHHYEQLNILIIVYALCSIIYDQKVEKNRKKNSRKTF